MDWLLNGPRLAFADKDEGDGKGDGGGDGDKTGTEHDRGGSGDGKGGDDGKGDKPQVSMSQEDLDRLVGDRVRRAEASTGEGLAKAAGFENLEAMQAAAKATKARDEDEKSDLDKATEARTAAERDRDETLQRLERETIRNAFITEAGQAKIPADRIDDALAIADLDSVTIKDGKVQGVSEAVKALVEAKPWLMGEANEKGGTGAADGGARGNGKGAKIPALAPEVLDMGQKMSLTRDELDGVAAAATVKPGDGSNAEYISGMRDRLREAAEKRAKT